MSRRKKEVNGLFGIILLISIMCIGIGPASAEPVEYNISQGLDYTGPFSGVMRPLEDGSIAALAWWNDNVGKKYGVKVNRKPYDTRYDPAVVASLWPTIVAKDKPIAHLGVGSTDFVPILNRLPNDKIIVVTSAPSYGFLWDDGFWVFQFRGTYMHEMAALLKWLHDNKIKDRPIRVGGFYTKVTTFVDMYESMKEFAKHTSWVDFVGAEWVPMEPVSLLSQVKKLAAKKPDYILVQTNTYQTKAVLQAEKQLGLKIPILVTTHNGIPMTARAAGGYDLMEGMIYQASGVDPALDPNVKMSRIFNEYKKKLGLESDWNTVVCQGAGMMLLPLRAFEKSLAKKGVDKITGEDVYNGLFSGPITEEEMLGIAPTLVFTKHAAFPKDVKIRISTVKDGNHVLVEDEWFLAPEVPKWVKATKKKK